MEDPRKDNYTEHIPNNEPNSHEEVPKPVLEEANDEPAGRTIHWTIWIAVIILAAIYFIFFY